MEHSKTLDFRFNGKIDSAISLLFDNISTEQRELFNELVAQLSMPLADNLDWWVQGPASRNTYASPFFHYYCTLHLLSHLLENDQLNYDRIRLIRKNINIFSKKY